MFIELGKAFVRQSKTHYSLYPLGASFVLATTFTTYILLRSNAKQEVTWNRWTKTPIASKLEDSERNPMRKFLVTKTQKETFKVGAENIALQKLIYDDGEYIHKA